MTNITRVIRDLIEANTYAEITANVGNTEPVTVDSIVFADQTFANTTNTSVTSAGGYIKLYGKSFEANANVLFNSTVATANVQSANEIRVNVPALSTGTYTLFLYNPSGSNAVKFKSIPVQGDFNYGWFAGGQSGTAILSSVERIDFNNDTVNTDIRGALPRNTVFASAVGTKDNGYIIGGSNASSRDLPSVGSYNSFVYRITYANDEVSASTRAGLSPISNRWKSGTFSKNYGYVSGGSVSTISPSTALQISAESSTQRLDFSSDSTALASKGPLPLARMKMASTSNDNYGWYIGGSNQTFHYDTTTPGVQSAVIYSIIDRLNFSSDTTTAIVRGPVIVRAFSSTTTDYITHSWIFSGIFFHSHTNQSGHSWTSNSSTLRMTFASDNVTAVTRSPAGLNSVSSAGSSDSNYGWITGGYPLSSGGTINLPLESYGPTVSSIFRITNASDTAALADRSTFFQARKHHTGNSGVVS